MTKKNSKKSMTTIDNFLLCVEGYWKETKAKYSRYQSWEHCYECFQTEYKSINKKRKPQKDGVIDSLSFGLAWYLASWGMYRGSSKLLMYSYKIHIPVIKILLNKKWEKLNKLECKNYKKNQELFNNLKEKISQEYKKNGIKYTDILVSKVLLGTLGCSPAFDGLFTKSISFLSRKNLNGNLLNPHVRNFKPKTMCALCDFYTNFKKKIEEIRLKMRTQTKHLLYPQMKILDMGFWYLGKNLTKDEGSHE